MSEVIETKPITETAEDQIIRLQAEMEVMRAAYEDLKTQAQARIGVLEGKTTTPGAGGDPHLAAVTSAMARDKQVLEQLRQTYFGSDPGCGQRAQELKRTNPGEYARLRGEFMRLSGQDKTPPPTGTLSKSFH
ncbi:MAG TPA: hypothetical protein VGQ49_00620 [Bryobacteraceae bacterium]|jgi:hypothetical protein|nr:hypothetical protein [Bryobacteraceae bacterium]